MPVNGTNNGGKSLPITGINLPGASQRQTEDTLSTVIQTSNTPLSLPKTDRSATQYPLPAPHSVAPAATFSAKLALVEALEEWQQLAVIYPAEENVQDFFLARGVTSAHHYVHGAGLNEKGKKFTESFRQRNQPVVFCSLQQALNDWQKMSIEERRICSVRYFARSRGIDSKYFGTLANIEAGLSGRAKKLTEQQSSKNIPLRDLNPMRNALALRCWLKLEPEQRKLIGIKNFAQCVDVSWSMFRRCASLFSKSATGLTPYGEKFYRKYYGIMNALLNWQKAVVTQPQTVTLAKFARDHEVKLTILMRCADRNGLTELGLAFCRLAETDCMQQSVRTWLTSTGSGTSSPDSPIVDIKQEPDDGLLAESCWEPQRYRLILKLNDAAPLLLDPNNPERSLTAERINPAGWKIYPSVELEACLKTKGKQVRNQFMAKANRFASRLIASDGSQQINTFDKYLSRPLQQFISSETEPAADRPAPWGLGIFAETSIPALTILGGYSGVLLDSEEQIARENRAIGCERNLGYSWTLPADACGHAVRVSAFRHSNRLALINTNQMYQLPPLNEAGIMGAAGNNIALLFIDDLIPLYVTIKAVKKGQQLLVDYGPGYDPLNIKKETSVSEAETTAGLKRQPADRPEPSTKRRRV